MFDAFKKKNPHKRNSTKEQEQESILSAILSRLEQVITKLTSKQSKAIPLFTYEEAIQYFVDERPEDPKIEKGSIVRQPHAEGFIVIQVFLDSKNSLVLDAKGQMYGRQLVVNKLDGELEEAFGDTSMILME